MEVETKRSVADYFVVAGLPKENPQLLDDFSLEANLKPSAYQDPITDVTVIITVVQTLYWDNLCGSSSSIINYPFLL